MQIDPETLMSGVNWSVQLIGLLSAWKQDRSSTKDDKFQDFIIWLENHNFQELSRKIHESEQVSRELHSLLSQSYEQIDHKLDAIATAVTELAGKIDGLNTLDRAVSQDADTLSTQAREILKLFADQVGSNRMVASLGHDPCIIFIPENIIYHFDEPRFLNDDVASLANNDLIDHTDYSSGGSSIYSLTRVGAKLAKSLPSVEIRKEL